QRGHAVESEVEGSGRRTAQRGGLTGDERADAAASKGQACGELEVANGGVFVSAGETGDPARADVPAGVGEVLDMREAFIEGTGSGEAAVILGIADLEFHDVNRGPRGS